MPAPSSPISKFTFTDLYFLDFQWDVYSLYANDFRVADNDGRSYRGFNPLKPGIAPGGLKGEPGLTWANHYNSRFRFAGLPLSSGLRDVQGVNNNLLVPYTGAALTLFERTFPASYIVKTGGFTLTPSGSGPFGPTYAAAYDPNYTIDYKTRGTIVIDAQPRIISNLVANTTLAPQGPGGTPFDERDNPRAREWISLGGTQPGLRVSPLTGNVNPLAASSWMTLFGQFFDHGLDLVAKGTDGKVFMPVLPGDPLYNASTGSAVLSQGRSNTIRVEIGEGTTDSLLTDLGLTEFVNPGKARLSSTQPEIDAIKASYGVKTYAHASAASTDVASVNGGTLVMNGIALKINAGAKWADVVNAINSIAPSTGVTASFGATALVLTPASGESINRISPFIDLSQSYGSVDSLKLLLQEYTGTPGTQVATGKLLNKTGAGDTLPDWASLKLSAQTFLGLTLHDYNINEVPLIEKDTTDNRFKFVALNAKTGAKTYITDTADARLNLLPGDANRLVLLGAGVAFLDDIAPGTNGSLAIALGGLSSANPDLTGANLALLNSHYVAGDGRANENIGLTSIHQIFHTTHNQIAAQLVSSFNGLTAAEKASIGPVAPTGEELFEKAKLVTEMIYQHRVFAEFARKLSPNIGAFSSFYPLIKGNVSIEFSQAVYRLGHSQVTETIDLEGFDPVTGLGNGNFGLSNTLLNLFLKPSAFNGETTAGQVALGMADQVQYQIDQFVTETLRNNLLGAGLDLAAFNLMRGRDEGVPTLNSMREQISQLLDLNVVPGLNASPATPTAAALLATINNLRPYTSWQDFSDHLLVAGTAKNFIMAYARDAILANYGAAGTDWNALQLSNPTAYMTALGNAADAAMLDPNFMGTSYIGDATPTGNQDFNNIDLWIGGLAEAKTPGGMLGPVFDFIFALQMAKMQDGDRFYYLNRVVGTDFFDEEIDSQLFADTVMAATGVRHMYLDIMSVNDSDVEIRNIAAPTNATPANTNGLITNPGGQGTAGWVRTGRANGQPVYTFYGNPGEYVSATGAISPNGRGNSSEMIGGTDVAERINALGGNDTVWADGGNDNVDGGDGNDFLDAGAGADVVLGNLGDDFIRGGIGNDDLRGGAGIDSIFGQADNDLILGGLDADAIQGGDGADTIYGGDNTVVAGIRDAGDLGNAINGGRGNDTCYGGGGIDAINGNVGADLLVGGGAADAITCGLDNDVDVVWFNEPSVRGVVDTIAQFSVADPVTGTVNDILRFSQAAMPQAAPAGGGGRRGGAAVPPRPVAGRALAANQFLTITNATPGSAAPTTMGTAALRFIYNTDTGALWYDQDGNGATAATQVATMVAYDPLNPNDPFAKAPVLTTANFQIVA